MMYLDTLKRIADQSFNIDIAKDTREELYIIARAAYYNAARKKTKYSLRIIGLLVGKDHASVLHGIKKYKCYCRDYPEYINLINDFEQETINAFDIYDKIDVGSLTHDEIEIEVLKNKLKKEQNKNSVLRRDYRRATEKFPPEFKYVLSKYSEQDLKNFIETKMKPSIIMHKMQRDKMTIYNPRGKNPLNQTA